MLEDNLEFFIDLKYRNVIPGMYMIGDLGSVYNKSTGKYLSICKSEKGYSMIGLRCIDGKQHTFKLHRIVAVCFLGDRSNENLEVDHIDGNKDNNAAKNLEWVTHDENIRRANVNGLITYKSGEEIYNAKFDERDIRFICAMLEEGFSNKVIKRICRKANVQLTTYNLYDIKHHKSYRDITNGYNF